MCKDHCDGVQSKCRSFTACKSYYLSPLSIYIFGIVDTAIEGWELVVYVYHGGQGAKGGDNVASILYLYLEKKGWL